MGTGVPVPGSAALTLCLLVFMGPMAKSAQFPLHVWLPDAMEGPTPISALIHAATMVAAGVFLVARLEPLYGQFPAVGTFIAVIGTITCFLGASIALTQMDLKKGQWRYACFKPEFENNLKRIKARFAS